MNELAAALDQALDLGLAGEERWFRADVCRGIELREGTPAVDRDAGIIYGYSVITKGPALGHDMEIDDKTLTQVVELGNQAKRGIKSRFDHPNASSTSMGTFLGRTKNFRLSGARVLGDLHLNDAAKEAPQGNLHNYVLGLAQNDPHAFGASIVFEGKSEFQLEEDGTRKKDAEGKPLPRLARVETLLASDVVDDPAANPGGLFHAGSESLATKITAFLNRWAVNDFLPRLQALTAAHKEDAMSTETPIQTLSQADVEAARATGQKAERERVSGVLAAALPGQETLAKELIDLGATVDEAARAFKLRKLTQLTESAPPTAGGGAETPPAQKPDLSKLPLDDRCKVEWDTNEGGVREEFDTLSQYLAFKRAEAAGQVKILKK